MRKTRDPFFDERFLGLLERLHLLAKRLADRGRPGLQRSHQVGDGLEFADHRSYEPGDDIRYLDWPCYARTEKPLLRLFHRHSESGVAILLDCSASMGLGGSSREPGEGPAEGRSKFDYARRCAAALAYVAMGSLQRVTIAPFAATMEPTFTTGRNRQQILRAVDFLSSLRPAGRTDLRACADRFVARAGPVGNLLLISDLLDAGEALEPALALLRQCTADITLLHVYDPAEENPSLEGALLLENVETHGRFPLTADEDIRESYRRCWAEFRDACRRRCLAHNVTYVAVPTDRPLERLVLETLRQAGVLAGG